MSETKPFIKPTLNGAYYSSLPTSTTTTTTSQRPRRFKLYIAILVGFLFLAAVHHHHQHFNHHHRPKFHHVKASLTQFNLDTDSNILYYNLTLAAALHPHHHQHEREPHPGTLYASAYYYSHRFSADTQPRFNQETSTLELAFQGQNIVVLDDSEIERYNSEKELGKFRIGVKAHFERKFDLAGLKTMTFKATAECDLMVPLSSDGITANESIELIECELH